MKKHITFLCLFILTFLCVKINAQVGINTTNPKATLDVSTSVIDSNAPPGIIAPRISLSALIEHIDKYSYDQKGSIIYVNDIDSEEVNAPTAEIEKTGYYYFDGNKWVLFVIPDEVNIPMEPWRIEGTGVQPTYNTQNIVQNAQVGIGFTDLINSTAQFEIRSNNAGLLIPRMSNSQRDEIKNPANSLMVFNTDTSCFNFYKNDRWRSLCGDLGNAEIDLQDCASVKIYGELKVGEVVNSSNYLQLTVGVNEPGDYTIVANNQDVGVFFEKSGSFPNKGFYTINIPAIGAPRLSGSAIEFTITINDEVLECIVTKDINAADAKFNSISFVSADRLKKGEQTNGKKITISVNIESAGTFNFFSDTVNGVTYGANNVNLGIGTHQVTLYANGNPAINAGDFVYSINGTGNTGSALNVTVGVDEVLAEITSINCGGIKANDILKIDTPLTASNYLDIPVTTNSLGTYSISVTSTENPGFEYTGSGTITTSGTTIIRVYGTGKPTKAGRIPFTVTINGTTCNFNLNVVIPAKSVLMVGTASARIQASLNNPTNFGPNGTSKIEKINIIQRGTMNATQLRNAINNEGVQVILIGWGWNPNAECVTILSNFIKNKKGFVFWVEAQDDQAYIKPLIDQTFGGNITLTADEYTTYTAIVSPNVPANNPYLNGVFGDARGKYFRADDGSSWLGAVPSSLPANLNYLVHLPPNGGSGINSNSERYTELYGTGFLMYSDWGFLNYNNDAYFGYNNPIGYNTLPFTGYSSDGTQVTTNVPVPAGAIANWVIFGNAMDYIFHYVQQNFNPSGTL